MPSAAEHLIWLTESGYRYAVALPADRYACLSVRQFNTQVVTGRIGDRMSWDTAW